MHDEPSELTALIELRKRLADGLARAGLNKTQLATRAELGRTTVQEAFQAGKPAPSAETVVALARVLRLPDQRLLDLRRIAAGDIDPALGKNYGPGRPITEWDPHDLEVHPAGIGSGVVPQRTLSGYVPRGHDRILTDAALEAAQGNSRMLVLVGTSSTGKTRACWESVQPLTHKGWGLWHPFDPTRAQAALDDLRRVEPCTVVWLNEAQHYLGNPQLGERIAAAVHNLLTHPKRRPVLVLGTLWPEYADQYTVLPPAGSPDPHSRVREILAGRTLTIPDTFDQDALRTAAVLAQDGDQLLGDALTRAHDHGRVTQDLAGAPELLRRYEHGAPTTKAVLHAAMDARRLGVGLHLPQTFLTDAAIDYLSEQDYDELTDDWAEAAFADLARPVHGKQAPLRRTGARPRRRPPGGPISTPAPSSVTGPAFRLADYLEQHGRTARLRLCPPASFWAAAYAHLTHSDDLGNLALAAERRHRLQWAHHLRLRAADAGHPYSLNCLARIWEEAGDMEGAEALYQRAVDAGGASDLTELADQRREAGDPEGAEALYRRAADAGDADALFLVARRRKAAGDREGAEAFYQRAADAGRADALVDLVELKEETGDWEGVKSLYRRAAATGDTYAIARLADMMEEAGDQEGAEALYQQVVDADDTDALINLAELKEEAGDLDGAEALYQRVADAGDTHALIFLAQMKEEAEDWEGVKVLYQRAADAGDTHALKYLAQMKEKAGDLEGAEALYQRAADTGDTYTVVHLAELKEEAGDLEGAETLYQQAATDPTALTVLAQIREQAGDWEGAKAVYERAADAGHASAMVRLAELREWAGDQKGAETFYQRAADTGDPDALIHVARMRDEAGDQEDAETFYQQAANTGELPDDEAKMRWPYGLDPDGSPTPPWP
ncbi:tetratricopeptide repeat protein [Streptomyces griseocarneus]|uniref:Tetratricopeptide repeat protein n=1 Tax=Streptomyces griseocarneus TaxID=51201 RepID=A0ABX7RT32_9ACTN|nr:tetratricopeptide repeat protein [Streptomyces griseocarneus]QSY50504.1 tetratricopeptide repeat protein [Streptomyces griseocarneus]